MLDSPIFEISDEKKINLSTPARLAFYTLVGLLFALAGFNGYYMMMVLESQNTISTNLRTRISNLEKINDNLSTQIRDMSSLIVDNERRLKEIKNPNPLEGDGK